MAAASTTPSFPRGREYNLDDPNDVDPKDYPLYIQTVQGQTIRTLVEAIELILPEENFRFDSDGIQMLAIDVTQSLAIHLRLHSHRFEVYHCEKPVTLGISILNLLKIMKTVGNLHTLTLFMDRGDDTHLYIRIENPDKKIRDLFRLNLVDLDRDVIEIPDETFPSIITMPSADFQRFVRDMSHIGDYVTITSVGDMLSMKVRGDFAEQEKIFGGSDSCLNFLKSTTHEIIQGEFNLRCLVMFSRCTNLCNNIEMCFKNNYPLVVRYQVANLGDIKLALVPRVVRGDE